MGNDVSRATKGITNATIVSMVIVASVIQGHCYNSVMKDMTGRHGQAHKMFFTYAKA
jgi:hypothetical protein